VRIDSGAPRAARFPFVPEWTKVNPRSVLAAISAGLTLALLILAVEELVGLVSAWLGLGIVGCDFTVYLASARRFLDLGSPYWPAEFVPGFSLDETNFLYPPTTMLLMVPFLWLPAVLWWALPIGTLAWWLWRCRPVVWVWPILGLVAFWPRTSGSLAAGNTDMWIAAAVALGLRFGWPFVVVLLKPSFAPLAVFGARRRAWWLALGALALVSVPFGALWAEYLAVVRNVGTPLTYSLLNMPLALAPVIAWIGQSRTRPQDPGRRISRTRLPVERGLLGAE